MAITPEQADSQSHPLARYETIQQTSELADLLEYLVDHSPLITNDHKSYMAVIRDPQALKLAQNLGDEGRRKAQRILSDRYRQTGFVAGVSVLYNEKGSLRKRVEAVYVQLFKEHISAPLEELSTPGNWAR